MSSSQVLRRDRTLTGVSGGRARARLAAALCVALVGGLAASGAFASLAADLFGGSASGGSPAAVAHPYAPRELIVSSRRTEGALIGYIRARTHLRVSASTAPAADPWVRTLTLPRGLSVTAAAATVSRLPGVGYAVPNYLAHAAGDWYPDDPGTAHHPRGWERLQWNFMPADGVNAPQAWGNLISDHRAGARGVTIAVVDSGIAYRNWRAFRRSPDFGGTRFVDPCDLVAGTLRRGRCTDPYPLDHLGHGTFVAGTIAEATNNGIGLTGLAYGASIMPVRVLNANGAGTAGTIAAGVRYAVRHRARVINLSVEFPPGTSASQIPELTSAIAFAHARGAVVVAAAGNDYSDKVDYPAAAPDVIAVGATTSDGCLAAYSNIGRQITLVAPGGGDDSPTLRQRNCHPSRNLPDVYQMTFPSQTNAADAIDVHAFVMQRGWFGTSMAAPEVSAAAAMVIASGVIGSHPSPDAILARLEATARRMPGPVPNEHYGYGMLNIGAATARGGPTTPTTTVTTTTPGPPTGTPTGPSGPPTARP